MTLPPLPTSELAEVHNPVSRSLVHRTEGACASNSVLRPESAELPKK